MTQICPETHSMEDLPNVACMVYGIVLPGHLLDGSETAFLRNRPLALSSQLEDKWQMYFDIQPGILQGTPLPKSNHFDKNNNILYKHKDKYVKCIAYVDASLLCSTEKCFLYLSSIALHCSGVIFISSSTSTLPSSPVGASSMSSPVSVLNTCSGPILPPSSVVVSILCAELPMKMLIHTNS